MEEGDGDEVWHGRVYVIRHLTIDEGTTYDVQLPHDLDSGRMGK